MSQWIPPGILKCLISTFRLLKEQKHWDQAYSKRDANHHQTNLLGSLHKTVQRWDCKKRNLISRLSLYSHFFLFISFIIFFQWIISELACYTYSMVVVPLYDTLGPGSIRYIINTGKDSRFVWAIFSNTLFGILSRGLVVQKMYFSSKNSFKVDFSMRR